MSIFVFILSNHVHNTKYSKCKNCLNEYSRYENQSVYLPLSPNDLIFIAFALTQRDIIINDVKLVTKEVSCCYSRDIILVAIVMGWLFC